MKKMFRSNTCGEKMDKDTDKILNHLIINSIWMFTILNITWKICFIQKKENEPPSKNLHRLTHSFRIRLLDHQSF
jgi:hypothetical protein